MGDALGWRCKIGLLVDASDTVAQPEYEAMRPVGVTNHTARIYDEAPTDAFSGRALEAALVRILSAQPDHIVFPGVEALIGSSSSSRLCDRLATLSARPCSTAADALPAALTALECRSRIAIVATAKTAADSRIGDFFKQAGFDVMPPTDAGIASHGLDETMREEARQALLRADGPGVGAIVLLDIPCPVGRLAAEGEHWLGKPVVSLGTAIYWHALRQRGIGDKVAGFGSLLEQH